MQTFRLVIDPEWARPLRDELRWLGRSLGEVRELDVLIARLHKAAGKSREVLGPIFDPLAERHAEARARLDADLDSERFGNLKGRLIDACREPKLIGETQRSCREALPPIVSRAWEKLAHRGRALRPDDPDEEFHETRIRVKRVRYAAEAVAPFLEPETSKAASRFAELAARLQDVLGEHQDATVALATVQELATDAESGSETDPTPDFRRAVKRLARRQTRAAEKARQTFAKVWKQIDRPKRRVWLRATRHNPKSPNSPNSPQSDLG